MLLLDVVPLSLGIETLGGAVDKIIDRNTTVPCRATQRYSTQVDNQTAVVINIVQGERELAADCRSLGQFKLGGIPPMPANFPQVDVTFLVDANGLLTVSARELRSGREASVSVQPAHGLSQDEVERLVLESVEHAHADFAVRRMIELRNKAEADLRHTEKAMAQAGLQLTAEERGRIDAAVAEVRARLAGGDVDALHRAVAGLGDATNGLAQIVMNQVLTATLAGQSPDALTAAPKSEE
jgi:molecular chaperone DnaK